MTTEFEKEFFETFGIEPEKICSLPPKNRDEFCRKYIRCPECIKKTDKYPEITDRILLKLITFLADAFYGNYCIPDVVYSNLKSYILCDCVKHSNKGYIKVQIKELFNCNL